MTALRLLTDLLAERTAHDGARVAVAVDGGPELTYRDWDRRSNAAARTLVERGVQPGDRVGLYFDNTDWTDLAIAYLAVLKAAAVAVPLSSRFPAAELASVTERAGVGPIIYGSTRPGSADRLWTIAELIDDQDESEFRIGTSPESVAEILFTSGTTGLPKGVACTHAHVAQPLVDSGGWPPDFWRSCAGGTYLHANAVSTAGGQLRLLEPLGPQAMTVLALPVFDAERMCRLAAERRVAVVQLVPGMAAAIVETAAYRRHDLSAVQVVSLGCAAFPASLIPDLAKAFPAAQLVNLYELSEARHAGTAMIHDGTPSASVGRPRGLTEVRITDDAGRDVADGAVGEIRLRWRGLPPQHYFRDDAATAAVFQDGWTRTGDAGHRDRDGLLYIVDRIKDVIIRGGINISSVVVESALRQHLAVVDAAVVGLEHPVHGEEVAAAVVVRNPADGGQLRDFLRDKLAAHEIPTRFETMTELPRNASGKVLKRELRTRMMATGEHTGPARSLGLLTAIWSAVLDRDSVNPDDDFFALGGDSLQATLVTARVNAAYRIDLPVTAMFEHCRLADLAIVVDEMVRTGDASPPIPRLPRQRTGVEPAREAEEGVDGVTVVS